MLLKLIEAFRNAANENGEKLRAARKLIAYVNKHPMGQCLLKPIDQHEIETARQFAA